MRNRLWLMAAFAMGITGSAMAQETAPWQEPFSLCGWADAIQSVRTHSPHDTLTSRARLRLELTADYGAFYGFVSGDAEKNWQINGETGVDLQEAWLEYAADSWDIRVGRQIIIWGKADGVQVTDIISPPDYTESMTRELDEIRMPVEGVKLRLLGSLFDTQLIWIPVFKAAVYPDGDNPWAATPSIPEDVSLKSSAVVEPGVSFENSEAALKISTYRSGLDLAASIFYTWDDTPARHRTVHTKEITEISLSPEHHRMTVLGLECSKPWSDFVFRAEAAWYMGKYQENGSLTGNPLKKDQLKWLGGMDWSPGGDWRLTTQLTGTWIADHQKELAADAHEQMATLRLSKELLNQTLSASAMMFYGINDEDFYLRPSLDYATTDALHLVAGADLFWGNEGSFGLYRENSQLWVKIKYSF